MEKEQDVTVAKCAGFCPGVKRAIDKVLELEAAGQKPVYTIGPLIHNKQVTDMLAAKQITSINHPKEAADKSGVLVIRAHGITPQFQQEIESCGMHTVDATCPLVKRAHTLIDQYAKQGYDTVIVGDEGHAEVTGLLGYTQGRGVVVSGPEEAQKLPHYEKVNVVSQTTQPESVFYAVAEEIKKHADVCQISNTVCQPTKDRQKETVEAATKADLVIVVGGKHSANTARLAQLCGELCSRVIHIETEAELDEETVRRAKNIFITAGASTPNWVIDKVAAWVRQARKGGAKSRLLRGLANTWAFLVRNAFYTAAAASALTYVCMRLEGLPADPKLLAFSALFIFSLTHINRAAETGGAADRFSIAASLAGGAGALALAACVNWYTFGAALVILAAGFIYPFRHLFKSKILSLPGTKDVVTALGWAFTCAYLPAYVYGAAARKASFLAVFYALLLVFMRSVTLGFTSANKDLIIGKENFYKAFGFTATKVSVAFLLAALTAVLGTLWLITWKPALVAMLLLGNLYTIFIVIHYYGHAAARSVKEETIIDGQFFILWILSFTAGYL